MCWTQVPTQLSRLGKGGVSHAKLTLLPKECGGRVLSTSFSFAVRAGNVIVSRWWGCGVSCVCTHARSRKKHVGDGTTRELVHVFWWSFFRLSCLILADVLTPCK